MSSSFLLAWLAIVPLHYLGQPWCRKASIHIAIQCDPFPYKNYLRRHSTSQTSTHRDELAPGTKIFFQLRPATRCEGCTFPAPFVLCKASMSWVQFSGKSITVTRPGDQTSTSAPASLRARTPIVALNLTVLARIAPPHGLSANSIIVCGIGISTCRCREVEGVHILGKRQCSANKTLNNNTEPSRSSSKHQFSSIGKRTLIDLCRGRHCP